MNNSTRKGSSFLREALGGSKGLAESVLALIKGVEIDDSVKTAAVALTSKGVTLLFSPKFVEERLPDAESKRFVLMHELQHAIQGDLLKSGKIFATYHKLVNMAMDIYINGMLVRTSFLAVPPVFRRLYDPDCFPQNIMLPPDLLFKAWLRRLSIPDVVCRRKFFDDCYHEFREPMEKLCESYVDLEGRRRPLRREEDLLPILADIFRSSGAHKPEEVAALYWMGWMRTVSFSTFLEKFIALLKEYDPTGLLKEVEVILEHDPDSSDYYRRKGPTLAGKGYQRHLRARTPRRPPGKSPYLQFLTAVRAAICQDVANVHSGFVEMPLPSVIPTMGRREAYLLRSGITPIFYNRTTEALDLRTEGVRLYLDVSGSMESQIVFILQLTLSLRDLIGPVVYQFSNKVYQADFRKIEKGEIETTYGTDLDCVIEHAFEKRFNKILVVTDGELELNETNRRRVETGIELYLIISYLHGAPPAVDHWRRICKQVWTVELASGD